MEKGEVSPLSGYITIPRKSLSREEVFAVADRLPGGIAPPRNSAFRIPHLPFIGHRPINGHSPSQKQEQPQQDHGLGQIPPILLLPTFHEQKHDHADQEQLLGAQIVSEQGDP